MHFNLIFALLVLVVFASCSTQEKSMKLKNNKYVQHGFENITKDKLPKSISTIYFDFDSAKIHTHQNHHFTDMLNALNEAPIGIKIVIQGHTDRVGSKMYNKQLGLKRARNVKKILVNYGVPEDIIYLVSHGEEDPVIFTNKWSQRKRNRRVTVKLDSIKTSKLEGNEAKIVF